MHYSNKSSTATCILSSADYTVPTDAVAGYVNSYTMVCSDNSLQTSSVKLSAPGIVEQNIQLEGGIVMHNTLIQNDGKPVSGTLESKQTASGFTLFLNMDKVN